MANTTVICRELPKHFPYAQTDISVFSKKAKMPKHSATDAIAGALFLALPFKEKPRVLKNLDGTFHASYNNECSLYVCVLTSLQQNGSKDQIKSHKVWLQFVRDHKFLASSITTKELDYRVTRALRALPAPYHIGTLLHFSEESLALCRELENANEALAIKLHRYEECTPEDLLPIYNRAAFFIPTSGKDHWVSWGYLLQQFGECVRDQQKAVSTTLAKHPCRYVTQHLHFEHPLSSPGILENRPFRTFVAERTVAALEKAAGLTFPEEVRSSVFHSCLAHERLRKNISFHLTYMDKFVDQPIPPREPGEWADRVHLYTSFRILYNMMHTYVPSNYPPDKHLGELVAWIFTTNCEHIHSLHKPNFPRPEPGAEIANPIIPSLVVPQVERLKPLYKNNSELFPLNALTLFMIRPDSEYVDFLLACNDLPFAQISTKQAIEFAPLMDLGGAHERKMDLMRQVIPVLHKSLKKRSPHFFSIIPQGAVGRELREKVIRFNTLLQKSEEEEIDSDLYFRALKHYIEGKIVDEHFEMFEVFDAGVPDLDLILYALILDERTKYTEPRESDPPNLFKALHLLKPSWAKEIRKALNVYEERFLESHQLSKESVQYIYLQVLSEIPNEIKSTHIDAVIGYLKQLSGYPFSREQHLHLFCEFIALQDRRMVLHQNIQLIASIESFIGHPIELEGVYLFLCYHPDFSDKIREIENIFEKLSTLRDLFVTEQSALPFIDPRLVAEVDELHASMQHSLIDPARYDEFCLAYSQVQEVIGHIQFQIISANLFPYTTHLMRGFPKFIPVTKRKNAPPAEQPIEFEEHTPSNALLPICEAVPIHKEIHTSWEPFEGGFSYLFSIITCSNTYSGRATLYLSSETLKNEPAILSVIKDLSFFLANDTSDRSLDINKLNNHTSFDTLLASNPNAKKIWDAFDSPNKESYTPAIFRFIIDLRIGHRYAYLNTTTHEVAKKEDSSPMQLNLRTFLQKASQGNVWLMPENPTLLPPKFLPTNSPQFPFYSSGFEYCFDLFQEAHDVKKDIGELLITENGLDGLKLPLSFSSKPRHIQYFYQAEILKHEEEKKESYLSVGANVASETIILPGEEDTLELDGIEVTLSAVYKDQSVSFTVNYPKGRLSTPQEFNHWMKWQEVMLKSRIFERIFNPHSGSN